MSDYATSIVDHLSNLRNQAHAGLSSCREGITAVIQETASLQVKVQNEKREAAMLRQNFEELERTIHALQEQLPVLQNQIDSADERINGLNEQLADLREALNDAEDEDAKNRIRQQMLNVEHQIHETYNRKHSIEMEKDSVDRNINDCRRQRSTLASNLDKLEMEITRDERELHRLQDKCARLNSAFHEAEADVTALTNAVQKFSNDETVAGDISCIDECIECIEEYLSTSF